MLDIGIITFYFLVVLINFHFSHNLSFSLSLFFNSFPVPMCSDREQRGHNAIQQPGRAATAAVCAAGLRQHAGAVQPGGSRLEGQHAARHAVRQTQRAGHAACDGHTHVRAAGHRNTWRARWTQLTTVSTIRYCNSACQKVYCKINAKLVTKYIDTICLKRIGGKVGGPTSHTCVYTCILYTYCIVIVYPS